MTSRIYGQAQTGLLLSTRRIRQVDKTNAWVALDENVAARVDGVAVFELEKVDEQVEGGRDIRFSAPGIEYWGTVSAPVNGAPSQSIQVRQIYANLRGVSNSSGRAHRQAQVPRAARKR